MESLCSLPVILTLLVIANLISKGTRRDSREEDADSDLTVEDMVMLDMIDENWDKSE